MSAETTKPLSQASDAGARRISVDAYYGIPQASQPAKSAVSGPSSYRPVLSQAQLLQLDPHDRQTLDQLQHSLKLEWSCIERAYHVERKNLVVSMHNSRT